MQVNALSGNRIHTEIETSKAEDSPGIISNQCESNVAGPFCPQCFEDSVE